MKIGDVELYVESVGGGPPLVLLHGGPGLGHCAFKPTLQSAAGFATVVFFDQRGCGRSQPLTPEISCTHDDCIADLEGLRRALGLERMHLLGHSWGCYIALRYALQHEGRLDSLILVCPTTAYPEKPEQLHRWFCRLTPAMRKQVERITLSRLNEDEKATHRMEALLPLYFHNLVAMAQLRKCGIRVSARVIRRLIDDRRQPDLRQQLGKLRVPTLLIAGRHDQRTPPEYAREIAERVYYSRLVVLDGSGHFPFLEQPSEFLGLLREQVAGAH